MKKSAKKRTQTLKQATPEDVSKIVSATFEGPRKRVSAMFEETRKGVSAMLEGPRRVLAGLCGPTPGQLAAQYRIDAEMSAQWRQEVAIFVEQPRTEDDIEKCILSAIWPCAKFGKVRIDPKGKPIANGRFLAVGFVAGTGMFQCRDTSTGGWFAFPAKDEKETGTLAARLRFWAEAVPEHVRRLAAKLREQGRNGPDDVGAVLAAVKPLFAKLDPFPDSGDVALLHAFEERYRADALDALERAAMPPAKPAGTPTEPTEPTPASQNGGKAKRTRGKSIPDDIKQTALNFIEYEFAGDVKGTGWKGAYDAFSESPKFNTRIQCHVSSWRQFKRIVEAARKDRDRKKRKEAAKKAKRT